MGTLLLDSSFTKLERTILHKTFRCNCRELGIDQRDFSVQVRRQHLGDPGHYAAVLQVEPDFFDMVVNSNGFNLFDATSYFGHEAVHMKQHLHDELIDCPFGQIWKGQLYPFHIIKDKANYLKLPWEQEAFGRQVELQKAALRSLTPEEREHCHYRNSNGLVELWQIELEKRAA